MLEQHPTLAKLGHDPLRVLPTGTRHALIVGDAAGLYDARVALFSLFDGADLLGEFGSREEAERALDAALATNPSAAAELAILEFDENGERVGEPIRRAA